MMFLKNRKFRRYRKLKHLGMNSMAMTGSTGNSWMMECAAGFRPGSL